MAGPRIPPLPPEDWPAGMRDALAAMRPPNPRYPFPKQEPGRPKGRNVLGLLAQHPELARAYNTFNGHVQFASTMAPRERELLVLRVAAVRRAPYEWAQHVVQAGDAGLTDDEIDRVAEGPDAPGWSPVDRALLAATDELLADCTITDETWSALAAALDVQQLLDVIFTVGAYETLAMALNAVGIELDDDLPPGRKSPSR